MVSLTQYLADVAPRGIRIAEHPKYGGVHNWLHMAGSMHALGRAGDLNFGAPGAPAVERPMLLWAARLAEAAGLNAIYAYYRPHPNARTNANHRDHLHVDDSPVVLRALKPRYPGGNAALYRRILAEKPIGGAGEKRKPRALRTIRLGSTGFPVGHWQQFLNAANGSTLTVDGEFGRATERETKEWQRKADLEPDGVVGAKTWFRACYGVELGRKGTRVKIAQRVMGLVGDDADGRFGPATDERAKEVQRYLGVPADGVWGGKTIDALLKKAS